MLIKLIKEEKSKISNDRLNCLIENTYYYKTKNADYKVESSLLIKMKSSEKYINKVIHSLWVLNRDLNNEIKKEKEKDVVLKKILFEKEKLKKIIKEENKKTIMFSVNKVSFKLFKKKKENNIFENIICYQEKETETENKVINGSFSFIEESLFFPSTNVRYIDVKINEESLKEIDDNIRKESKHVIFKSINENKFFVF